MSEAEQEILQRARRIETRLTQFMIGMGLDTMRQQATFKPGSPGQIEIPSRHTSIKEILSCLPPNSVGEVEVVIDGDLIATLKLRPRSGQSG